MNPDVQTMIGEKSAFHRIVPTCPASPPFTCQAEKLCFAESGFQ